MSAMLHAVVPFFVVFSLCLRFLQPWLWLLLLVTVVCSNMSSLLSTVTMAPLDGASSNIRSAWCGSTTTTDTKACWRCGWPCQCATGATSVSNAPSGLCKLCYGSSTGRFLFESLACHHFVFLYVWCLFWCMLSAFRCHAGCFIHIWVLNHWGLYLCNPLELTQDRDVCNLVMVISPHQVCTFQLYGGHTALEAWQRVTWSLHVPCLVGRVFFSRFGSIWWHGLLWICIWH